jgi:hypothetical protein
LSITQVSKCIVLKYPRPCGDADDCICASLVIIIPATVEVGDPRPLERSIILAVHATPAVSGNENPPPFHYVCSAAALPPQGSVH